MALEMIGKGLRERDPALSAEQVFIKVMELHPDLANIAVGVS